ncbi:hypothetical protein [Reticulibacter mediterranei]|nr:hypothetical protein [Reticulibacter mediterranei]
MTGERPEKRRRIEVPQGSSTSLPTGDSNIQRLQLAEQGALDQGGPSKRESGDPVAAMLARRLEESKSANNDSKAVLPSSSKLQEMGARLGDTKQKAVEGLEQVITDIQALKIESEAASPSLSKLQEMGAKLGDTKQKAVEGLEQAEQEISGILTDSDKVEEDLPEEFRQALQIERTKLDKALAEQQEKLSKASPEEIREGLQQIPEEMRGVLQQMLGESSDTIKLQREELDKEDKELHKMQEGLDDASPSERAKLEKILTAKRAALEELRKTVQSLEQMEQIMKSVMEQGQPQSPGHPEQGSRS